MKNSSLRIGALVSVLLLVVLVGSCNTPSAETPAAQGYAASSQASAMDGRSDVWVKSQFGAEEQDGATPTVTLAYAANAGDDGDNDGALKVAYSGESGTKMGLEVFTLVTPASLPTSGTQTISIKVKPVSGCVTRAVAFIYGTATKSNPSGWWYETTSAVALAADAWTTVSVAVDPSTFTSSVWRIGVKFLGDAADPAWHFAPSGTIYVDDFSALDYRKNDFSSSSQLEATSYWGTDDSTGTIAQSWEASSSAAGDGYLKATVTFPSSITGGWGAYVGGDFATNVYTPVDLSKSTLTFRVYVPQQWIDDMALGNTGTWLSIYYWNGTVTQQTTQIWYAGLTTITAGWNTVSVNFADSRLGSTTYSTDPSYDYTKVTGFNIGIGTGNTALQGAVREFKLDYVDLTLN